MNVPKGGVSNPLDLDWGSYVCHFYDSRDALVETLLPFALAGLRNNEACLWLTAEPLSAPAARDVFSGAAPDFEQRCKDGQVEIVDRAQWNERGGSAGVVNSWIQRKDLALAQGFSGLRVLCNVIRPAGADPWIDKSFVGQPIIGLFSYDLKKCSAGDVLDAAARHQFVWVRRLDTQASGAPASADHESVWLQRRSGTDRRAEDKLREADKRKNEFLSVLGHELRNPLASILTASQLMMLRGGDQQFHKELDIIQRQVSHITSMVDDLLDVSRIIAGRVELDRSSLEIAEAVNRAIEIATPLVAKRSHRLHVTCPPRGLAVHGDLRRLAQIVSNLLTNAARYTDPGGDITVRAERVDGSIVVSVADTGRGIDPQSLAALFQPFVQGGGRKRGDGGLGLGLSIVRSLVDLHGGTIEAASILGKGSEFVVRLPPLEDIPASVAT